MYLKMKRPDLFLTFMLFTVSLVAQKNLKTKRVTSKERHGKAIYYVLKDNPEIKHGKYIVKPYATQKKLLVKGQYNRGKKTGEWITRYTRALYKGLKSKGTYENDQKVGEWLYFDYASDTIQIYNHSTNTLVHSELWERNDAYFIMNEFGDFVKRSLKKPAECVGGLVNLEEELLDEIAFFKKLPVPLKDSKENQIDTRLLLIVDEKSKLITVDFSQPIGYGYEEKIRKWIFENKKEWVAAQIDGKPVTSMVVANLKFSHQF